MVLWFDSVNIFHLRTRFSRTAHFKSVVVFSFLIKYMNIGAKFMREFVKTNKRVVRAANT